MRRRILVYCFVAVVLLAGVASFAHAQIKKSKKRHVQGKPVAAQPVLSPSGPAAGRTSRLKQVTYPVADLVVPVADHVAADVPSLDDGRPAEALLKKAGSRESTIERQLIDLISSTVAPTSWSSVGGPGTIQYFPLGMALVVNQSAEVHEEIAALMAALRKLQDLEVALDIKMITVPDSFLEKIGLDFDIQAEAGNAARGEVSLIPAGTFVPDLGIPIRMSPAFTEPAREADGSRPLGVAFLSDIQRAMFLEAAQRECRAGIRQAPKVTLFNGQTGNIQETERQTFMTGLEEVATEDGRFLKPKNEVVTTGLQYCLTPVVSADRRFVRLSLNLTMSRVDPSVPLLPAVVSTKKNDGEDKEVVYQFFVQQPKVITNKVEQKLNIPDGQTALLHVGHIMDETRQEYAPPILSRIPYVNRLFRNVGYGREARHMLLLVTPRIIVCEDEETAFGCEVSTCPKKRHFHGTPAAAQPVVSPSWPAAGPTIEEQLEEQLNQAVSSSVVDLGPITLPAPVDENGPKASRKRRLLDEGVNLREKEQAIRDKLQEPITVNFKETPLRQILDDLRTVGRFNLVVDRKAIEEAWVDLEQPVSLRVENISLSSALNLLLKQARLDYVIQNEVLNITTEENARGKLKQVTYPVTDLVVNVATDPLSVVQCPEGGLKREPQRLEETKAPAQTIERQLIDVIVNTVAPHSWQVVGGPGTIQYFPLGMAFVINQTHEVHEEIAALLTALRKLQDTEVAVTVLFATVHPEFLEKLQRETGIQPGKAGGGEPVIVPEPQGAEVLRLAQEAGPLNVMAAPKVTVFNGQSANVHVTQENAFVTDLEVVRECGQTMVRPKTENVTNGIKLFLQPAVSAERDSVRLALNFDMTEVDSLTPPRIPVTTHLQRTSEDGEEQEVPVQQFIQRPKIARWVVENKLTIPSGHTAILDAGPMQVESRGDFAVPEFLHWTPCGPWLTAAQAVYQHVSRRQESRRLLLLVTPRIIINEEEEQIFLNMTPPVPRP